MIWLQRNIFIFLLTTLSYNLYSDDRLYDLLTAHKYFSANFIQKTGHINSSREINGLLHSSREGKFRLEYFSPLDELFIANGEFLNKYDPLLEQLEIFPLDNFLDAPILGLLTNDTKSLKQHFRIIACTNKINLLHCRIEPFKENSFFKNLNIYLEDEKLSKISFEDYFEQKITVVFDAISNKFIDPSKFSFEPPFGTDIIRHN